MLLRLLLLLLTMFFRPVTRVITQLATPAHHTTSQLHLMLSIDRAGIHTDAVRLTRRASHLYYYYCVE